MEKNYNKLVRDNIPDIITKKGATPITRILSSEEYKQELEKKLIEECNEVIESNKSNERIEELADTLEVIIALAKIENKELVDIIEMAKEKRVKRGAFDKKVFLETVIEE